MHIDIETTLPALDIPREALCSTVCRVLRGEGRDHAAVTVILVDDPYIRQLNHKYRHLDRATDVLSFNLDDGTGPGHGALGDVYISVDRARDQAGRYHVSLDDELHRLVVHGCLHLLGYDHHNASERKVMREKERVYSAVAEASGTPEGHLGEKCCG